ncbi:MAG TPA: 4'-phosphopantetheinyl transferase superfamily protein [Pyrinomonadaceae bacterium]|jgi:4'-phosphopantetheinyl transferase
MSSDEQEELGQEASAWAATPRDAARRDHVLEARLPSPSFEERTEAEMIRRNEVHVWHADLDRTAERMPDLLQTLTPDEREKAGRFRFRKDRDRFVVARGLLRAILGDYLQVRPRQLRFTYGPHGKPSLPSEFGRGALQFNLSHSQGQALYAVACRRRVGVDIEQVRSDFTCLEIAQRFFSSREVDVLRSLPPEKQTEAFFNCWTRKEAYIKARGEGLSLPLDQFSVSLAPGEPAALLSCGESQEPSRWSLRGLEVGPGFVAALAVEGHDYRLKCREQSISSSA